MTRLLPVHGTGRQLEHLGKVNWLDTGGNEWAKIGLMIRDEGGSGSKSYWGLLRGGIDQIW